ncbi:MAG: trehalose-phosphatase [Acidimicrobiia bacterium]
MLQPFTEAPERCVVVVDFDGTLAPIVDDPALARPLPGAAEVLDRLAGHLGQVAVVSGRPVDFLRRHLAASRVTIVGQYGLERLEGGRVMIHPAAREWTDAVAEAARRAEVAVPGVHVERKGEVAVTLHWRRNRAVEAEALALAVRLTAELGLAAQPGRLALELRPPLPVDKGTVAEELAGDAHAALVAGDDHGDLPFFDALDRLTAAGRLDYGLRVGVVSPEAPPALLARADHQVDGPPGLLALLDRLAGLVAG